MKVAVLSMDIEDWYHLDYFDGMACDHSQSLLDGVGVYREILAQHDIPSSFFVLGELVEANRSLLSELIADGHDVGVHGWDHVRPLTMTLSEFSSDLQRSKKTLEDAIGSRVQGYRAPCFSLDRERLDQVQVAGFDYDSSRILFENHPLYGTLDMRDFTKLSQNIYHNNAFFEFQISTLSLLGKNIPVSGGGYIRLLPWFLMRRLIKSYLRQNELYVLYVHPFELSPQPSPPLPTDTRLSARIRFRKGRCSVATKLLALIGLLKKNGYRFTTFAKLQQELPKQHAEMIDDG